MTEHEIAQGKPRSLELSALPKLIVPVTTEDVRPVSSSSNLTVQPHALSVDFQYNKGDVSPVSEVSPSSRCSVVSLSPSLFPLPPIGNTPPPTAYPKLPDSPPQTLRSQTSIGSWFSPPSPPPSSPLPPTPVQKRLASLIAFTDGLESVQPPASVRVKSPLSEPPGSDPEEPLDTPMTPPLQLAGRRYTVDSRGFRESVIDPDAPLSPPPRSSLPPPYSPGLCTPERLSSVSVPSSRVDSTTPLAYNLADYEGSPRTPRSPPRELGGKKRGGVEEGWRARYWQTKPQRRRRKIMMAAVGAASAALVMVIAGIAVGIYVAVTGSTL